MPQPDAVTQRYLTERESLVARSTAIKEASLDQDRDLSDQDRTALANYRDRIKELDDLIDLAADDYTLSSEVAQRIASMGASQYAPVNYRTAGEVVHDLIHQGDPEARRRYTSVTKRAAEHMGTSSELTTPVAGGLGSLSITPVTGPVVDLKPKTRPLISALGVRPVPSGYSFIRPRIVDPNFQTGVGIQDLQKEELASQHFDVKGDTLTLDTYGGYLNVSQQVLSFTPGALDVIVSQLSARLAYRTEAAAAAALQAASATVDPVDMTDGAAVRAAIYAAASKVYASTGHMAEWVVMGPEGWAALGSLVDLANRPLFPTIGPSNADGVASPGSFQLSGFGLNGIVTPVINDGAFYVGNSSSLEAYEYRYPMLEAVEPSVLGRQIAVAASLAFYSPAADDGTGTVVEIPAAA